MSLIPVAVELEQAVAQQVEDALVNLEQQHNWFQGRAHACLFWPYNFHFQTRGADGPPTSVLKEMPGLDEADLDNFKKMDPPVEYFLLRDPLLKTSFMYLPYMKKQVESEVGGGLISLIRLCQCKFQEKSRARQQAKAVFEEQTAKILQMMKNLAREQITRLENENSALKQDIEAQKSAKASDDGTRADHLREVCRLIVNRMMVVGQFKNSDLEKMHKDIQQYVDNGLSWGVNLELGKGT